MKRFIVVLVVLALAALTAVVWAAQGPPDGRGMDRGQGMDRGMGMMMGQAAVAASGNSVYVVSHGMLLKYNTDLMLEKQVELPMPERGMGGGMGRGGRGGGMRGGGGMGGGEMK